MSQPTAGEIPFGRPMVGPDEKAAVLEALESPQLVHGQRVREFERSFAEMLGDGAYATAVSSCTAGLHLSYLHLGLTPGDEVIVPAETHVATAHAVEITGAKPVFVDCDETGNIDIEAIEPLLTERTKAICVVHYPGLPVDVIKVNQLARPRGVSVIEDCALAVGASLDGISCGLLGDIASFSFYPVKHMTTGEGGMVVSRDPGVIASISSLKAFGYDRSPADRSIPGVYDIARLGINYRMSEMAAAIGLVQLRRLQDFADRRSANAATLRKSLADSEGFRLLPGDDPRRRHSNYCLIAVLDEPLVDKRDEIVLRMRAAGVGTSVYYPVPLPLSHYYTERYGYTAREFPNASRISLGSVALPVGPHLDEDDMVVVAEKFKQAVEAVS